MIRAIMMMMTMTMTTIKMRMDCRKSAGRRSKRLKLGLRDFSAREGGVYNNGYFHGAVIKGWKGLK
jgi:hypothetical protein